MDWAIIFVVYATLFIANPIIVTLHELGHAIAYLTLTKSNKIDIYVGSYSGSKDTFQFRWGKIDLHIKLSFPIMKSIGLCKSDTYETNRLNYIVILLAGPVFTLLAIGAVAAMLITLNLHLLVSISCYILLALSALSLLVNLIPMEISKSSNSYLYSDGKQILFALRAKRSFPDFVEGCNRFEKKDYELAISKLKNVLEAIPGENKVLRLLIHASIIVKRYEDVIAYSADLERGGELSVNETVLKGIAYSAIKNHHEAIETYNKALKKDRNNIIALNNIGFDLIKQNAHEVAKRVLERAIKIDPAFSYAYSNLGLSYTLQGNLDEAKVMLEKGIALDEKSAYGYKYLGLYYLRSKDITLANKNFMKAAELDSAIDLSEYEDELRQINISV